MSQFPAGISETPFEHTILGVLIAVIQAVDNRRFRRKQYRACCKYGNKQ